jgi:putative FmdB family regulatory protein
VPAYDYECRNCGHRVEVIHGVHDSGPTACEQCGGPMRKLLSTPAIVFKGSGWAKKDARDSRPTAKSGSSGSKESSSESSSDTKSTSDAGLKEKSAPAKESSTASPSD